MAPPVARETLLVVDDDKIILDLLCRTFKPMYEVYSASSGESALTILKELPVDLLITDQKMPGMTGLDLIAEARKLLPELQAILLTAYTEPEDLIAAINEGRVYRYVTKPWSPEELKIVIAHALEHYQLGRDNAELIAELKRKNAELKAMATRVADAFLKRLDKSGGAVPDGQLAMRDILAAAAYPTVKTAAKAIVQALTRARDRLRDRDAGAGREAGEGHGGERVVGGAEADYFDVVTRDCLAEARRILSVVDEIDEIAS